MQCSAIRLLSSSQTTCNTNPRLPLILLPLRHSGLVQRLSPPPLTTMHLPPPLILPHTLSDLQRSHTPIPPRHRQNIAPLDRLPIQQLDVRGFLEVRRRLPRFQRVCSRAMGDVEDELGHARGGVEGGLGVGAVGVGGRGPERGDLDDAQLAAAVGDVLEVAADAVFAFAEFVAPAQEVAACAGGFDAEVFELGGGEGEEVVPGWDFGGVRAQVAADEGEEGWDVGDEGGGFGDGAGCDVAMEGSCLGFVRVLVLWLGLALLEV